MFLLLYNILYLLNLKFYINKFLNNNVMKLKIFKNKKTQVKLQKFFLKKYKINCLIL